MGQQNFYRKEKTLEYFAHHCQFHPSKGHFLKLLLQLQSFLASNNEELHLQSPEIRFDEIDLAAVGLTPFGRKSAILRQM